MMKKEQTNERRCCYCNGNVIIEDFRYLIQSKENPFNNEEAKVSNGIIRRFLIRCTPQVGFLHQIRYCIVIARSFWIINLCFHYSSRTARHDSQYT
jgi:hypothetical protein